MKIAAILESKGDFVATVAPDATVNALLASLAEHEIGAVVVSSDGVVISGIASERDVARALGRLEPCEVLAEVTRNERRTVQEREQLR